MDIIHDNSRRQLMQLATIVGATELPDYVQDYIVPDAKIASALRDELFADPGRRMYPIDSKGATWLSAGYYALAKGAGSLDDAARHPTLAAIKFAADVWGIGKDVNAMLDKIAAFNGTTKSAADMDENYGWLIKDVAGNVVRRRYPMFDAEGVQKAAAFFVENRRHYANDVRRGIASKIVEKAAQFGVSGLPEAVEKEAGQGIPSRAIIVQELGERARLAKDAEFGQLVENVNKVLMHADEGEVLDAMNKLADVIAAFDEAEGLVPFYGIRISYPADFLMSLTQKEASEYVDNTVVLKRHAFDARKLAADVPLDVFEAALGSAFAEKFAGAQMPARELKAALDALSPSDKAALEQHLIATY